MTGLRTIRRELGVLVDGVLRTLFPAPCPLCGSGGHGGRMCETCFSGLPRLDLDAACLVCAAPMDPAVAAASATRRCGSCLNGRPFVRTVCLGPFTAELRRAVLLVKYAGRRSLGFDLGRRLAVGPSREIGEIDAVVAVPLSRHRRRQRGYDQAEVIAKGVASGLGRPVARSLRRVKETAPQTGLSRAARLRNLAAAFEAKPVVGQRIALVDDVVTTGATVAAAARALTRSGAREVVVLAIARTDRDPIPQDW